MEGGNEARNEEMLPWLTAAMMNNRGTDQLINGRRFEAMRSLVEALKLAKLSLERSENVEPAAKRFRRTRENVMTSRWICPASLPSKNSDPLCAGALSRANGDRFVFQRPMQIEISVCRESEFPANIEAQTILPAVIIFNLGLANQLIACHLSDKEGEISETTQKGYLRKAVILYQYAYCLHQTAETVEPNMLLLTAIMNNSGQAYQALGERDESDYWFRQVLSTILLLIYEHAIGDLSDFNGFLSSVFHLLAPPALSLHAAAA